jgi:MFS family permease
VDVLHLDRNFILMAVLGAATLSFVSIPFFGHLSDRLGRKRIYMFGAALVGCYGFAYFRLLDTRMPYLVGIAIVLSLVPHDIMYGPQAALIAESFPGRLRYSGASLGYQLSSLIAGGPAPLIATALLSHYRSATPLTWFILACAVISLIATAMLKDHTNKDVSNG